MATKRLSVKFSDCIQVVVELKGVRGSLLDLVWAPNGKRLVAPTTLGELLAWDVSIEQMIPVTGLSEHLVTAIDWNSDASVAACGTPGRDRIYHGFRHGPLLRRQDFEQFRLPGSQQIGQQFKDVFVRPAAAPYTTRW